MNALLSPRTRLFDDFFKDFPAGVFVRPVAGEASPAAAQIRIDVTDQGASFLVQADLPGVRKEDVQVHVEGAVVTLGADVPAQETQADSGRLLHAERPRGSLSRSFQLPAEVDQASTKARLDNGVLTLLLPKASAVRTTRVAVD
ncbi:Hsp20/alpha crystallin family protein [Ideonella livida]|uniref:Hsp20/alpha crystallin family protein n=1 Tax=Ideonella livida TaxID=2707176 RepID=A0A7C9PGJ2_9BURK|nr:Hsp20/alpha crystallin family protein [Ideonella livida]NDY91335.1 Hsp20/alpha crystallin family protein [Ideonella livida]